MIIISKKPWVFFLVKFHPKNEFKIQKLGNKVIFESFNHPKK